MKEAKNSLESIVYVTKDNLDTPRFTTYAAPV